MHLVLSGEGSSDLGLFCNFKNMFIAGSMYYLVDKIVEQKFDYSFYEYKDTSITFIPKKSLTELTRKLPPYTGKKSLKETAYFINNAIALAKIAKKRSKEVEDEVIAILFRDSDGTNASIAKLWEEKVKSIEDGFKIEKFDRGVAMVPNPKSEAWLICGLKKSPFQNCKKLEERSGNDDSPNSLKKEFKTLKNSEKINEMIQDGRFEIDKIDMPSFEYFQKRINYLLS